MLDSSVLWAGRGSCEVCCACLFLPVSACVRFASVVRGPLGNSGQSAHPQAHGYIPRTHSHTKNRPPRTSGPALPRVWLLSYSPAETLCASGPPLVPAQIRLPAGLSWRIFYAPGMLATRRGSLNGLPPPAKCRRSICTGMAQRRKNRGAPRRIPSNVRRHHKNAGGSYPSLSSDVD